MAVPFIDKLYSYPGVRGMDLIHLSEVRFVLATRFECEDSDFKTSLDSASGELTRALGALQVVGPSAEQHLFIVYRFEDEPGDPVGVGLPFFLTPTPWASEVGRPLDELRWIPLIARRTAIAEARIPRIRRALILYFQGLREHSQEMRILSWAMGIDVLTMASNRRQFCDRVRTVLGAESWVLPLGRPGQPSLRIDDVIEDVYSLRSELAHGSELSGRFSIETPVVDSLTGTVIDRNSLVSVLEQCTLFILHRLIRTVLVSPLFDDARDDRAWRTKLSQRWELVQYAEPPV